MSYWTIQRGPGLFSHFTRRSSSSLADRFDGGSPLRDDTHLQTSLRQIHTSPQPHSPPPTHKLAQTTRKHSQIYTATTNWGTPTHSNTDTQKIHSNSNTQKIAHIITIVIHQPELTISHAHAPFFASPFELLFNCVNSIE